MRRGGGGRSLPFSSFRELWGRVYPHRGKQWAENWRGTWGGEGGRERGEWPIQNRREGQENT